MFLLRTTRTATAARVVGTSSSAPFSTIPRRFAGSDYGSGAQKGDKTLEKASSDKEHPGPPPPSTGGDSKPSESSSTSSSSEKPQSSSNGSKAQPKILSDSQPTEGEQSDEVKKHNADFRKRADRPYEESQS